MPVMQSTYTEDIGLAYLGQMLNGAGPRSIRPRQARGYVDAGYAAFRVSPTYGSGGSSTIYDPGEIYQIPNPGAAADVDAIEATITSSTSIQTITSFDGVVGSGTMYPPRQITFVASSSADWDATDVTITGIDAATGAEVTETLALSDGGNETLTTTGFFSSVTSVGLEAQSGTGGTATVGVAALTTLTAALFDGVVKRDLTKNTFAADNVYNTAGASSAYDYGDNETLNVVRVGSIWVYTETATNESSPVYVRIASGAGGSHLGAFRSDSDSSSAVLLSNAYFRREAAAGMNVLTLLA